MSTPIHAVATPLNTCRASRTCRACRDERVAPCCPTARHVSSRLSPIYVFYSPKTVANTNATKEKSICE